MSAAPTLLVHCMYNRCKDTTAADFKYLLKFTYTMGFFEKVIVFSKEGLDILLSLYPGLLTPAVVACSTNTGEGQVTCSDILGRWVDIWRSDTFPRKKNTSRQEH